MIKVWLSGAKGQVGTAINEVYDPMAIELLNTDKDEVDITNIDDVTSFVQLNRPDVIINCSGITNIDQCEKNPSLAFKVNALGARNLSIVARNVGAKLLQVSTDDVFDGHGSTPYTEFDSPAPRTVYGKSKMAGELYVKEFTQKHFIVRSTWVYGKGYNFVNSFLKEIENKDSVCVAEDQYGSPTSAKELAKFILSIITTLEYGTYHATCKGVCSRADLATEIANLMGKQVNIVHSTTDVNDFATVRPAYAVLDNFIMGLVDVYTFPDWKTALADYIRKDVKNGK